MKSPWDIGDAANGKGDSDIFFRFQVSLDEEHVFLQISRAGKKIDLGERVHHYCLLTLARRRLADACRGIEESAQGWIDAGELSAMLGIERTYLNIQLLRARRQLVQALSRTAPLSLLVDRRRGEVRFPSYSFEIVRGNSIEGLFSGATAASMMTAAPQNI